MFVPTDDGYVNLNMIEKAVADEVDGKWGIFLFPPIYDGESSGGYLLNNTTYMTEEEAKAKLKNIMMGVNLMSSTMDV